MPIIEQDFMELTENLDLEAFWEENVRATPSPPTSRAARSPSRRTITGSSSLWTCPSTLRYYHDKRLPRRAAQGESTPSHSEYVGRAFFNEDTWETRATAHRKSLRLLLHLPRRRHAVAHTRHERIPTNSPASSTKPKPPTCARGRLPEPYLAEWEARKAAGKPLPRLGTGSRGPATIMTSVLKPETVFYWMYDHPDLMRRFRDILAEKMVEFNTMLREFSGNDRARLVDHRRQLRALQPQTLPRVLLPRPRARARRDGPRRCPPLPALRQRDGPPAGNAVRSGHPRRQLRPDRGRRPHPREDARRLHPRATAADDAAQRQPGGHQSSSVIYDFEKAGANGGLEIATAGSLAAGTGVGRMRYLMKVVQEHCRYD